MKTSGTLTLLLIGLTSVISSSGGETAALKASHQSLDWYPGGNGDPKPVATLHDWELRRAAILAGFESEAGKLHLRENLPDLDIQVSERIETEN